MDIYLYIKICYDNGDKMAGGKMIDNRINTFLKVCETMNYTAAAKALNLTQPAVSQHIRYLESHYGAPLFAYAKKQLSLTPQGEILLRAAETLSGDETRLKEKIQLAGCDRAQEVIYKAGATMTVGEYALVRPLASLLDDEPEIRIDLTVANTDVLLEKLRAGEIDFAVIEGYFHKDIFGYEVFSTEKYIPVCAAGHRFTSALGSLKELTGLRLIMREKGSGTRDIMEKNLQAHGLDIRDFSRCMEVSSLSAIIGLVKEDCGITFLYEAAAHEGIMAGQLKEIRLDDFAVEHDFTFVWNKGSLYENEYRSLCRKLKRRKGSA